MTRHSVFIQLFWMSCMTVQLSVTICHGQIRPDQMRATYAHGVDFACSIGDIAFVYNHLRAVSDSELPGLSNVCHPAALLENSSPDSSIVALSDMDNGIETIFEFSHATITDYGDFKGFWWKVTWDIFPKEGGFSGTPKTYSLLADSLGRPLKPRIFLCSFSVEKPVPFTNDITFSTISYSSLSDVELKISDEGRVIEMAKSLAAKYVEDSTLESEFIFQDCKVRKIPEFHLGENSFPSKSLWEVTFVNSRIPKPQIVHAPHLKVWIDGEFETSDLTLGYWNGNEPTKTDRN